MIHVTLDTQNVMLVCTGHESHVPIGLQRYTGISNSDCLDVPHRLVFSETVEYEKFRNPGSVWVGTSVNMC